jgi:hypothetical protein
MVAATRRHSHLYLQPRHWLQALLCLLLLHLPVYSAADDTQPILLSDEELDSVRANGFYFRVDMGIEVFTAGDEVPQVVMNSSTPVVSPTDATSGSFSSPQGFVSLSGSAQSNISSLVNVVGAASVINVGINVVNIGTSTNDTIFTTNTNVGVQGSNTPAIDIPITP